MRVLWFAPMHLPAVTGSPSGGGGWVEGLRRALEEHAPEIELGIAYPGPAEREPVVAGNATYFSVAHSSPGGRFDAVVQRWRHDPVPPGAVERCAEIARTYAPDVVHCHGTEHYYGLAIPLLSAPAVISLQGIATVCERFALGGLRWTEIVGDVPSRAFASGHGSLHGYWHLRSRAALERRIIASCNDFMGRTEWDRAVLRMLHSGARYHEVGEVLGEPFYQEQWSEPRAGEDTLFCTGGSDALKGVETLLEALIIMRRAGLRSPRLRFAGGVDRSLRAEKIVNLVAAPELQGSVDVLGKCTPTQIAGELAAASAFVLPSHIDNSPNALCEAMLVGTPCIAAFVGGVPSLVRDGVEGLLYHDADPYALAGKIDRLLGDPALATRLGAKARETAMRRHDPRRVAKQAVGTYREVIDGWCERQPALRQHARGHSGLSGEEGR